MSRKQDWSSRKYEVKFILIGVEDVFVLENDPADWDASVWSMEAEAPVYNPYKDGRFGTQED